MSLTKDKILSAIDAKTESVEVPEWGGSILLRVMSGRQRNNYEFWAHAESNKKSPDFRGIRERLIVACAIDDHGKALFDEKDVDALSEKNSEVIDRLHKACQKINGMDDGAVEEAAKN